MRKLYNPFWVGVTVVLSLIFAVMLPVSILESHGVALTVLYTVIGLIAIWASYFVRAYIFSGFDEKKSHKKEK